MSIYRESGIEIDLSAAVSQSKHDRENSVWQGVDFIIEESNRWIWLELKNWEPSDLAPRRRGGHRRSFLAKMQSKTFFKDELRGKFTGTTAFLTLKGKPPAQDGLGIIYVVLLESPKFSNPLKLHAIDRMRNLIRTTNWNVPVSIAVIDLADWNREFPDYPAKAI